MSITQVQQAPDASRTRSRILAYLASAGPVRDPSGHANRALRDALGFAGSTGAFTQMLASMDQGGLLVREVQGRRTYSISLGNATHNKPLSVSLESQGTSTSEDTALQALVGGKSGHLSNTTASDGAAMPVVLDSGSGPKQLDNFGSAEKEGLDYDRLALSMLQNVARILSGDSQQPALPKEPALPKAEAQELVSLSGSGYQLINPSSQDAATGGRSAALQRRILRMERAMAALERDLARAKAERNELEVLNIDLTTKLEAAQRNAELLRERAISRRSDVGSRLGKEDALVLRQLSRKMPGSGRPKQAGPVPGWPRPS